MSARERDPADGRGPERTPTASGSPFEGAQGFREAVLRVIQAARVSLLLVDRDFSEWPLESAAGESALREALHRGVRLRLLLRDPQWLDRRGARFARLRRRFSHAIECRALPETMELSDSFAAADRTHIVRRVPPDAMRGAALRDMPAEVSSATDRAEAAWDESELVLPPTTLGL